MNKTDAEIEKALECCVNDIAHCFKCPYNDNAECSSILIRNCFDYFNRLKAENERLNKEVDRLSQCVMYHDGQIADAIKEFAERLKDKRCGSTYPYVLVNDIDNLVKEMTENEGKE